MQLIYLRAPDRETLSQALHAAGLTTGPDHAPAAGVTLDIIGPIYRPTGVVHDVDGVPVPETAPVPGWHANALAVLTDAARALLAPYIIPAPATPERVFAGLFPVAAPAPTDDELRRAALARINAAYTQATDVLATGYPYRERESWHVQTGEAARLLADESADTPWIDAAAAERGIDRLDLAQRIASNDGAYREIHGRLSGIRQRLETEIQAAPDAAALDRIQWPPPAPPTAPANES